MAFQQWQLAQCCMRNICLCKTWPEAWEKVQPGPGQIKGHFQVVEEVLVLRKEHGLRLAGAGPEKKIGRTGRRTSSYPSRAGSTPGRGEAMIPTPQPLPPCTRTGAGLPVRGVWHQLTGSAFGSPVKHQGLLATNPTLKMQISLT